MWQVSFGPRALSLMPLYYTIVWTTSDLTVVQKRTEEVKTQKITAEEAGCSQSSESNRTPAEAKSVKAAGMSAPSRGHS